MNREISVGIIGIVVSCVFLALTMVAAYKGSALILARSFYWLQMFCFVFALSRSFVNRIYIGWKTGEATSLTLSEYKKALAERPDS